MKAVIITINPSTEPQELADTIDQAIAAAVADEKAAEKAARDAETAACSEDSPCGLCRFLGRSGPRGRMCTPEDPCPSCVMAATAVTEAYATPADEDPNESMPDVETTIDRATFTIGKAQVTAHHDDQSDTWSIAAWTHEATQGGGPRLVRPPALSDPMFEGYLSGQYASLEDVRAAAVALIGALDAWYETQYDALAQFEKAMTVSGAWSLPDEPEDEAAGEASEPQAWTLGEKIHAALVAELGEPRLRR